MSQPFDHLQIVELQRSTGDLVFAVEFEGEASGDGIPALEGLVDDIVTLGERGAFCVAGGRPALASMASRGMTTDGVTAAWTLAIAGCDPRVTRVIGHAALALSAVVQPVRRVILRPVGVGRVDGGPFAPVGPINQKLVYPAGSALDFEVFRELPVSFRHGRRCVTEFRRPLTTEEETLVIWLCECWARVVFGAYPTGEADLLSGAGAIFNVSTQRFDDRSMETVVDDFGGSEAAWIPLLNSMGWIHERLVPVHTVTIE